MEGSGESAGRWRVAVVACDVLGDEVRHYVAGRPGVMHVEFVQQGLHNEPARLQGVLQGAIDRIERESDAEVIVLVYGLCSRGTEGLRSSRCRLVLPRAHDCITLLLGDKERYARYVAGHPGTYWYSPGWNRCHVPPGEQRHEMLLADYTRRYGAENAAYLMEAEQQWFKTYDRATYVDLTIGATDEDVRFTRQCAQWLEWTFDRQKGDPGLLVDLLGGPWDEGRFVVIEPGWTFRFSGDERVIEAAREL